MEMIGKELGQYMILAEVGRGGMGIVYRAYQKSLNRKVALKILPSSLSTDENLVKRFHREAEAAARLSHPNIVQIFDISETEGIHFFAMEYLKGGTLTQKIEKEGSLPIKEAVRIAIAVADALSYSHAEGIIHRDIKPGNIMIDPHGHVKVTDFGLARAIESTRLTMAGTIIGTPEYMSPEQARGETLDGRSDLYSLGIVLYEALTAKMPFEASTPFAIAQKQIYEPLPCPSSIRPEIPKALEEIILKVTEKDPGRRYRRGEDFKKDLDAFAAGRGLERIISTVPVSSELPPRKKVEAQKTPLKRIGWRKIALAAVLFIAFLAFIARVKEKSLEKVEVIEEKGIEDISPLSAEKPSEDEVQKILDDTLHLTDQRAYSDAISRLEEFMERFPDHSQANLIPAWIKDIHDKERGERFKEAQKLADHGDTVQAILEFNQIARDYPETKWETKANEKVKELKRALGEGEAGKEFLEAQELRRKNKFIEATQLYQSIISRFPGTIWAEKSEEEITKLKEAQARLPAKGAAVEQRPGEEMISSFETEIEDLVRSDRKIMHFLIDEDSEGLAQYLQKNYPDEIQSGAEEVGVSTEKFLSELTYGMVEKMKKEFARPGSEPLWREPGPEFKQSPEEAEKLLEDIKKSDPKIGKLIGLGDEKRLAYYLWSGHKADLEKIAMAMHIPEREIYHMAARYLMGDNMAFEMGPRPGRDYRGDREGRGREDFRDRDRGMEREDFRPEDELFEKFRRQVGSNKTVHRYIKKGDVEGLSRYLMREYYKELRKMSEKLGRPVRDLAWEFSERLVHEREDEFFQKFRRQVGSNKTIHRYIEKRDVEDLSRYLMRQYYKELRKISKELDRPLEDLARDFSERLVHEREDRDMSD